MLKAITDPDKNTGKTAAQGDTSATEPATFLERIGTTNYEVSVLFSKTSKETLEDKIFRLIESEVRDSA